jgi:4'-phosphopantetheinyl transferase EntD
LDAPSACTGHDGRPAAAASDGTSRELFGLFDDPRVHVLTGTIRETAIASLSAREAAALTNVARKRRREFATARSLAREGLERFFGVRDFDLLNAKDRSPTWPRGIAGSISHSDTRAWVALVDAAYGTVGIDGEDRDELKQELWRLTLRREEQAYLATLDPSTRGRRALILFSAKEALYKAQYPRSHSFMGYQALQVELERSDSLRCTFRETIGPFPRGYIVNGRWSETNGVVTTVCIPHPVNPNSAGCRWQ